MAITRATQVRLADVWADDEGGVTVLVPERVVAFTVQEAAEFVRQAAVVIGDALGAADDAAKTLADLRDRLASPAASEGVF